MLAHFVRRIAGGLVQLCVASLVIFYIVVELPGGPRDIVRNMAIEHAGERHLDQYLLHMKTRFLIDQPWPHNYFAWLFDPYKTVIYDLQGNPVPYPNSVNISIGNLQLKGTGVLTGELGTSMSSSLGTPVADIFALGLGQMFAFLTTLIATLMALVAAQRWRRPQPYRASTLPTASALVDWWQLHSRSPTDVAIMGRLWA